MAANKRATKERGRRSPVHSDGAVRTDRRLIAIRAERRALMRADSVLRCVAVALEYNDGSSKDLDYAEAIEVARSLVSQSIERLELQDDDVAKALRRDA